MENYIKNFEDSIKNNPQVKEFKQIEAREGYILCYYAINMGLMTDRDVVCEIKYSTRENGDFIALV